MIAQRLRRRTGEALRGSAWSFARASSRASSVAFGSRMIDEKLLPLLGEFLHGGAALRLAVDDGKLGHYAALSVLNGNRNAARSALASSSDFAVVVMEMFKPRSASILSYSISGKMICSLTPML